MNPIYTSHRRSFTVAGDGLPDHNWEVHYDATVGVYNTGTTDATDGQTIATWADQSGNGNDLTQSTEANKPTYDASAFGGVGGVRFNADWFDLTTSISLQDQVYTCFHVINRVSSSLWSLSGPGGTLGGPGVLYGDNNMYAAHAKINRYWFENYGVINDTNPHIYTTQSDTIAVDQGAVWFDGVSSTPISTGGASTAACTQFGRRGTATSGAETSNGYYGEFLLTFNVLSLTEIEEVETYLGGKWGITVS